jgi:hypothetical protein
MNKSKNTSSSEVRIIREAIIREQLKRMFSHSVDLIDVLFCAHELCGLIDNFKINPRYNGGKC